MGICIIVGLLIIVFGVSKARADKKGDKERALSAEGWMGVLAFCLLFCLCVTWVVGENLPYTMYNLRKSEVTIELAALPYDNEEIDNRFVYVWKSLKEESYYCYALEGRDGTVATTSIESKQAFIDKRDGEKPHLEMYFGRGFKNFFTYLYAIPNKNASFEVIVLPESEVIEETFSLG